MRATYLAGGLDLHPEEVAGKSEWKSLRIYEPSNPIGLKLILKRVSGLGSTQEAASDSSLA